MNVRGLIVRTYPFQTTPFDSNTGLEIHPRALPWEFISQSNSARYYGRTSYTKQQFLDLQVYDNVTLMYAKHEKIPMKDFGSEVRATMDIDHLLNKAVLLLDLPETSLEEIFNKNLSIFGF
ncbi:hypothetical protein TTRE_0000748501 [Trichuris trichiura]|uniref:Uncharacterized protein n=1 Tax=Trichuris trichiura TaxID=36087 RepID=A0A077ZKP9_TRITR|nr:hypothetical protein TTRE_0000748501 [Trichuris trichiura]